jgi:hypothetical protein
MPQPSIFRIIDYASALHLKRHRQERCQLHLASQQLRNAAVFRVDDG